MTAAQQEFDRYLRDRLSLIVEAQPELLLEHDGGPEGLKADLILATLYGMDEQVDAEWRIPRVEPYLLRPIQLSVRSFLRDEAPSPSMTAARYELQSNWAGMTLDWLAHKDMLPAEVKPDPGTYLIRVAFVRYRRRA